MENPATWTIEHQIINEALEDSQEESPQSQSEAVIDYLLEAGLIPQDLDDHHLDLLEEEIEDLIEKYQLEIENLGQDSLTNKLYQLYRERTQLVQ